MHYIRWNLNNVYFVGLAFVTLKCCRYTRAKEESSHTAVSPNNI